MVGNAGSELLETGNAGSELETAGNAGSDPVEGSAGTGTSEPSTLASGAGSDCHAFETENAPRSPVFDMTLNCCASVAEFELSALSEVPGPLAAAPPVVAAAGSPLPEPPALMSAVLLAMPPIVPPTLLITPPRAPPMPPMPAPTDSPGAASTRLPANAAIPARRIDGFIIPTSASEKCVADGIGLRFRPIHSTLTIPRRPGSSRDQLNERLRSSWCEIMR